MSFAFLRCSGLVLSTSVMALLKAVMLPLRMSLTKSSAEGCDWRFSLIDLTALILVVSGSETPFCSCSADDGLCLLKMFRD
jgi:hypothetical protein